MAIDFADYVDENEQKGVAPDKLERLSGLAARLSELEGDLIPEADKALKALKAEAREIAERKIPDLFQEIGVTEVGLPDGSKVKVRDYLSPPSMAADSARRLPMIAWLEQNDLDDVVKDTLTVPFGKGDTEKAKELAARLEADGYDFARFRTVNSQTLGALLRELREGGRIKIPYDDLGISMGKIAKLE